jgi:hypothetical protein
MAAEAAEGSAAYALARERGWLSDGEGSIRLGELCFLIMKAFEFEGSFLYTLFPGPRYAFRELDYLKLIPGRGDPARKVSGEELLRILGKVQVYRERKDAAAPAVVSAAPPPPRTSSRA